MSVIKDMRFPKPSCPCGAPHDWESRLALANKADTRDELIEALEYMADKESWYVDKDGWMVLLRPRDTYVAGEASAYIEPWVFAGRFL